MNFCPNCGHNLKLSSHVPVISHAAECAHFEKAALVSLKDKLHELAPRFHGMSDEEFGDWVDALELAEFVEYVGLGNEGIARVINEAMESGKCLP